MEKRNGSTVSNIEMLGTSRIDTDQDHSTDYFESWKICMENANAVFDDDNFVQAEILYKKTISVAISAFSEATISKQTISMLLVSFHNIADLYARQERFLEAELSLEGAFVYIQVKQNGIEPNSEEDVDLTWGLMKARRQLETFTTQNAVKTQNTDKCKHQTPGNNHSNHVH